MDLQEQKKRIIEQIEQIDDSYSLNQIEQLLGTQLLQEPIVAYGAEGQPMTKNDLIARIEQSQEDLKNGDYLTQEEFERESDRW